MARTAQRPPSNRAIVKFDRKPGVHYTEGHELPEDVTCGDGPIDKLLERGYEIVAQQGRKVVLACPQDEYDTKIRNGQIESSNRLKARDKREEKMVAGKDEPVVASIDGMDRPVETVGEIIASLPDRTDEE